MTTPTETAKKNTLRNNVILVFLFLLLIIAPLAINQNAEYGGADGNAEAAIVASNPDYKPWSKPLWEPPSGEIESLLFAAQASIGTGFIAYFFGLMKGRKQSAGN